MKMAIIADMKAGGRTKAEARAMSSWLQERRWGDEAGHGRPQSIPKGAFRSLPAALSPWLLSDQFDSFALKKAAAALADASLAFRVS
jgi:hypothetical protein